MNLERFTQKAQETVIESQQIAQDLHQQAIEPAHLLLVLVQQVLQLALDGSLTGLTFHARQSR